MSSDRRGSGSDGDVEYGLEGWNDDADPDTPSTDDRAESPAPATGTAAGSGTASGGVNLSRAAFVVGAGAAVGVVLALFGVSPFDSFLAGTVAGRFYASRWAGAAVGGLSAAVAALAWSVLSVWGVPVAVDVFLVSTALDAAFSAVIGAMGGVVGGKAGIVYIFDRDGRS